MQRFETEVQVGELVWSLYGGSGFATYAEVTAETYDKRADLVAIREKPFAIEVVEIKLAFGLDVIAQAENWLGWCHSVYVAVPEAKRTQAQDLGRRVCERLGIGIIRANRPGGYAFVELPARVTEDPHDLGLRHIVTEEHARRLPGSSTRTTERPESKLDRLMAAVAEYVREQPKPVPPSVAVANVAHDFRRDGTACQALLQAGKQGKIPGIECYYNGRRNMLRPAQADV